MQTVMIEDEQAYTILGLAEAAGFSHNTIRKAIRLGHLDAVKVGGVWVISRPAAQRWLDTHINTRQLAS